MAEKAPSLSDIFTEKGNKYARDKRTYTEKIAPERTKEAARKTAANVDLAKAMAKDKGPFGGQSSRVSGPGRSPSTPKVAPSKVAAGTGKTAAGTQILGKGARPSNAMRAGMVGLPSLTLAGSSVAAKGGTKATSDKGDNTKAAPVTVAVTKPAVAAKGKGGGTKSVTKKATVPEATWADLTRTGRGNNPVVGQSVLDKRDADAKTASSQKFPLTPAKTKSTSTSTAVTPKPGSGGMVIREPTMGYGRIRGVKERQQSN